MLFGRKSLAPETFRLPDPEAVEAALQRLQRGRRRGLWFLVVAAAAGAALLASPLPGIGALVLVLAVPALLIFLLATQIDISRARKERRLPDTAATGRPRTAAFAWVAAVAGIPLVIVLAGGMYWSERNSDYKMFAAGERLAEVMNAVDGYYSRHGRLPASVADLGLAGAEAIRYKKFDLEEHGSFPVTFRVTNGRVELSLQDDPAPTVAFAPDTSGKDLRWNLDPTGSRQGRARGLIAASAHLRLNSTLRAERQQERKPACGDRLPADAIEARAGTANCSDKAG